MHCRMAPGGPAGAHAQQIAVVYVADIDLAPAHARPLDLSMAPEAQVGIPLQQELGIYGSVRGVADRAALSQGRMFKDNGPGLLAMARRAGLVEPRHRQATRRLEDVSPMRVVALGTTELVLRERMVLRKPKLSLGSAMALVTGRRVLAGIDDELAPSTAAGCMQAARSMTGFAPGLACGMTVFQAQPGVGACRKNPRNIRMALRAGPIPDKSRTRNNWRRAASYRRRRTGWGQKRSSGKERQDCDESHCPPRAHGTKPSPGPEGKWHSEPQRRAVGGCTASL